MDLPIVQWGGAKVRHGATVHNDVVVLEGADERERRLGGEVKLRHAALFVSRAGGPPNCTEACYFFGGFSALSSSLSNSLRLGTGMVIGLPFFG